VRPDRPFGHVTVFSLLKCNVMCARSFSSKSGSSLSWDFPSESMATISFKKLKVNNG
jgi:hypothetical protein